MDGEAVSRFSEPYAGANDRTRFAKVGRSPCLSRNERPSSSPSNLRKTTPSGSGMGTHRKAG
jgi:hypothetical protein